MCEKGEVGRDDWRGKVSEWQGVRRHVRVWRDGWDTGMIVEMGKM